MFADLYGLTDPRPSLNSEFSAVGAAEAPGVGAYGDGVLSVLDDDAGDTLLRAWTWLLPAGSRAVLSTEFGDVFYWQPGTGICVLDVQRAEAEFVAYDVPWFLNEFDTAGEFEGLGKAVVEQLPS